MEHNYTHQSAAAFSSVTTRVSKTTSRRVMMSYVYEDN